MCLKKFSSRAGCTWRMSRLTLLRRLNRQNRFEWQQNKEIRLKMGKNSQQRVDYLYELNKMADMFKTLLENKQNKKEG